MTHKLLAVLGLILLALLATAPASAATDESGIGIRLLDVPAATQTDPRARSYIIDNLPPGTTIERRIQVQNNTSVHHAVEVYAGAARIEGNAFLGDDGAAQNDLSSWMSVDRPQLQMAPGDSVDVLVTIAVPDDAAEGEQYAAIWAEVRSDPGEGAVVSASRVGIRAYISVGPGNGPPVDFTIDSLTANRTADGKPELVAAVTNTGGRAIDLSGELILEGGRGGLTAGPFALDRATTIAPGENGTVTVTMDSDLPSGPWSATVTLTSGLIEREATASATFPKAGAGEAATPEGPSPIPLIAGVAAALVVAVVIVVLAVRNRRLAAAKRASGHRRH